MEINQIIGYILAVFVGITLGLIGSGGSILSVPILVYVMKIEPVLATAYSLFVVGTSALLTPWQTTPHRACSYSVLSLLACRSLIWPVCRCA